jgi:antirestriction protein ArdC
METYAIVTEKIINLLESDVVPWDRRPWTSTGLPRNLVSKKPYRGVNFFCSRLRSTFHHTGSRCGRLTKLDGHVHKGEESTAIVYWKIDNVKQSTEVLDNEETGGKTRRRFLLRF